MKQKKREAELHMYIAATCITVAGLVLCLAGLLLPHWYTLDVVIKDMGVINASLGLWQDKICIANASCQNYWLADDSYSRHDNLTFPYWKMIQGIETSGTAVAMLSLLSFAPLWIFYQHNNERYKLLAFSLVYATSLVSGFLSIIGCLVISSKVESEHVDYAPLFSGIGGALILISVGLSCAVCRYDPTYGTLENPVSPLFSQA